MDSCPPTAADWAQSTADSAKQVARNALDRVEGLEQRVLLLEAVLRLHGILGGSEDIRVIGTIKDDG